jgi:Carboxypeptidase regulatory-like domain/TonB-dependent Receptor Plug Domain
MKSTGLFRWCLIALLCLGLTSAGSAQTSEGTLVGTVTDQSGAVVPNAKIKVVSSQRGDVHETTADSAGTYRVENLQPGTYQVTFNASGFAELKVSDVILSGSVTTTINGKLDVSNVNTSVTVEASAAQVIDTQSGQLGESMDVKQIENLPFASFNPAELALTLPGVQDTESNNSFTNGISYSVNGTRPRANNFLIDGQDDNDYGISGQAYQPTNLGAIQEITVLTNAYSAEFGRGGGSVANYIYKSGTNQYHGQLWEVNQDSAFGADPSQDKFLGLPKPLLIENTYGFDIGGPAVKDKLFFFAAAQWDPTAQRGTGSNPATGGSFTFPTTVGVATLKSLLPNNNVQLLLNSLGGLAAPSNLSDPNRSCISITTAPSVTPNVGVPCPNTTDYVESTLFARSGVKEESHDTNYNVRMDYHPTNSDSLTGSYIHSYSILSPDFFANPGSLPPFDTEQNGTTDFFRGQWTHTFSPSVVNELRFSYTSIGFNFTQTGATLAGPLAGIPEIDFGADTNYPSLGVGSGFPQGRSHQTVQVQDAISYSIGRHTIKGGVDTTFLKVRDGIPFNSRGDIVYSNGGGFTSLGNYIDDFTGGTPGGVSLSFGNPIVTPTVNIYAPYVEDTFRFRENLTLTMGLRYEYWGTLENSIPFPAINYSLGFGVPGATFPGLYSFQQIGDKTDFGPRLGFAYTPHWGERLFGHNATVIRGGYGIFYDGLFTNIVDNTAAGSPNATGGNIFGGSTAGRGQANAMAALASITPAPSPFATADTIRNHLENPMTQQWNLNVQRELPLKLVVTASYVGTRGERLFGNQDFNPGIGFDQNFNAILANPNFGEIVVRSNVGSSWYNAAQLEVDRTFRSDLVVRASYTYSKFTDDVSEVFATTTSGLSSFAQNLECQVCDWGPSTFDRRHRFVFAYVWSLPYSKRNWLTKALTDRWQWSSIGSFDSGSPDTPFDGFDNQGNHHPNSRPDVSNPNQPITATGIDGTQLGLSATPGTFFPLSTCFFGKPGTCAAEPASDFRFIIPASGPGNAGRNSIFGPGQIFFDTSIERRFPIPIGKLENQVIEFRTEFFNALNHPNLFTPSFNLISNQYDNVPATINGGRIIKFWLRYEF